MPRYRIDSTGNGTLYTITRIADGATIGLAGDDAVAFSDALAHTSDRYTDDDAASEYDHVMAPPSVGGSW